MKDHGIARYRNGCRCIECRAAHAAHHRELRARKRDYLSLLKAKPCADCGVQYPWYVMQFDHTGDKAFTISQSISSKSNKSIAAEAALCDVVCSNCHAERTHQRRKVVRLDR